MLWKKIFIISLLAGIVAALSPLSADAESRYYSRQDIMKCENQGQNTVAGAVIGGLLGYVLGGKEGAAMGAIGGSAVGLASSCHDQVVYIENVDRSLDDGRDYNWRTGSVTITNTFYRGNGEMCRVYESSVETPSGWIRNEEVACRQNGMWMHGYETREFESERRYEHSSYERHYEEHYYRHGRY